MPDTDTSGTHPASDSAQHIALRTVPQKSDLAIAGLIVGIASVLDFLALGWILSPIGVGINIAGLVVTRKNTAKPRTGRGLAIAGLVVSGIGVILSIIALMTLYQYGPSLGMGVSS
jgi:hypothetical protein